MHIIQANKTASLLKMVKKMFEPTRTGQNRPKKTPTVSTNQNHIFRHVTTLYSIFLI
jgi:hypothetical protein